MSLPPLPGLIPISSFNLRNVTSNLRAVDKEVMGEQRSRRIESEASDDLIDNAPSSQAPRAGKTRRKSQRKHKQVNDQNKVSARVNPIFVWVRQENNTIVDVKCEDYDKRNRIVLTKTPHGWRAMPRTEILAPNLKAAVNYDEPNLEDEKPRKAKKSHHHRHHKVKRKSTAVQVDNVVNDENIMREAPIHTETLLPPLSPEIVDLTLTDDLTEDDKQNKCEVSSPLDNLLAVAELEFNQQIQQECEHAVNETQPTEVPLDTADIQNEDCDYNEDDDIVMNQILMQLEQSLQSPETTCDKPADSTDSVVLTQDDQEDNALHEEPEEHQVPDVHENIDGVEDNNIDDLEDNNIDDDEQPTDLSIPKVATSPRPHSRCSITIQSPQPSGLPPVPPSPDVIKTEQKQPESEDSISSSLPEKKNQNEEDSTLKAMLSKNGDKDKSTKTTSEPSRLLELLMSTESESPLTQLKRLLTDPNISMPDPLLIPKSRLSAILTAPGKEIPRLLYQRPELRLPEALKHADLLKNPDILVITVHQLKTILQKQLVPDEKSPPKTHKPEEKVIEAHSLNSLLNLNPTAMMSWLPYLQQLEMAAMTFGHQDFLKMLKGNSNSMGAFPPSFPMSAPPLMPSLPPGFHHFYPHHNQFEYPIYHQQFTPASKNHCCASEKPRHVPKFAPYFNPQQMRSSLQIPQYNPNPYRTQKHQKPKVSSQSHPNKNMHRDKCAENNVHQTSQHHNQSQQPMDLSRVNNVMLNRSKYNKRLNNCDPSVGAKTNAKFDDTVPEVGSTTASLEDFSVLGQEAPKNVWHPLFTNPKATSNPNNWNWPTSVTATGE